MLTRVRSEMHSNTSLAALTLGRLGVIPLVVVFLCEGIQVGVVLSLSVFLVMDYYDGILARSRGADGPARRALDSTTDRIAIWTVYITMAALSFAAIPLIVVLATRDVYCARACHRMMRDRFVAIGADWPYRGVSALLALWVMVAPELSSYERTATLSLITFMSVLVALDLRSATRRISTIPATVCSTVISAHELRSWQLRLMPTLHSAPRQQEQTFSTQ